MAMGAQLHVVIALDYVEYFAEGVALCGES